MKMKKLLALLLSATMTVGMLAGCGGSQEAAAPAATEEAAPAAEEEAPAAEEEAPAAEASGEVEEITFMVWDDLAATEDLISKGYADSIERFNKDFE